MNRAACLLFLALSVHPLTPVRLVLVGMWEKREEKQNKRQE
jgi:hypothetical protein